MRFMPRFNIFPGLAWVCLLVMALWVAAPVYSEESGGYITAVNAIDRVIEVDGTAYKLSDQAEIIDGAAEDATQPTIIRITELQVGTYVQFTTSSNVIQSLRVFENGPPS